jgi:hypothetical protein
VEDESKNKIAGGEEIDLIKLSLKLFQLCELSAVI